MPLHSNSLPISASTLAPLSQSRGPTIVQRRSIRAAKSRIEKIINNPLRVAVDYFGTTCPRSRFSDQPFRIISPLYGSLPFITIARSLFTIELLLSRVSPCSTIDCELLSLEDIPRKSFSPFRRPIRKRRSRNQGRLLNARARMHVHAVYRVKIDERRRSGCAVEMHQGCIDLDALANSRITGNEKLELLARAVSLPALSVHLFRRS